MENSTDASTCAFRSHDVLGQRGTLTPKPTRKHKVASVAHLPGPVIEVNGPLIRPKPVRRPALPTRVQMNISKAASLTRSDFDVSSSMYRALSSKNSNEINISHKLSVQIKTSPADRLKRPAIEVGPVTVVGLVCDKIKNGKLATRSAPKTPISIASHPFAENEIWMSPPRRGEIRAVFRENAMKIKARLNPTSIGRVKMAPLPRVVVGAAPHDKP